MAATLAVAQNGCTVLAGGARSGKSSLSVDLGRSWPGAVVVIATAEAGDDDMATRIQHHRDERPASWSTIEEPRDLAAALAHADDDALVIVDCLTLWVTNLMLGDVDDDEIVTRTAMLMTQLSDRSAPSLVITNEVGLGVHPTTGLGRHYRDLLGRVNQCAVAMASTTLFLVAGRAFELAPVDLQWATR